MSEQCSILVTMELLSDAIFGSGYSIPGGEDLAVCQDDRGFPWLRGSTMKGLLRESLQNWLVWTGGNAAELEALLGREGWDGAADGRRVHLTELRLAEGPEDAEDCYSTRSFTALERGVAKAGALRTAACIRAGLRFRGELYCAPEDAELLCSALSCIRWVGTMRSRGFGSVRVRGERGPQAARSADLPRSANCLRYRLRTLSPLLVTDLSRSSGNGMETRGYLPGAAVRGMVVSALAASDPDWFAANRLVLLGDDTCFLDAVPVRGDLPVLPAIRGFYEDKTGSAFETVLLDGTFKPGLKRAKLGSFCAPDGETLRYWSAASSGATRIGIHRADGGTTDMFQTRYLDAGQELEAYILLKRPELAERIARVLSGTVWLGADRFGGFGKCAVSRMETAEEPAWRAAYGCRTREDCGTELYLLAVSPFTMLDGIGSPCGLDEAALAEALGVGSLRIRVCSTAIAEFGGYNRTWQSRVPAAQMYDRGSIFHLSCDRAPEPERLRELQREGLGIRRAEGFGQILFLRPALLDGLKRKAEVKRERTAENPAARARSARYRWIMDHVAIIRRAKLSASQIGTLQSLCEKAIVRGGDLTELELWLDKNLKDRGVQHAERFRGAADFVREILSGKQDDQGVSADGTVTERLKTLSILFDFSRKSQGEVDGR